MTENDESHADLEVIDLAARVETMPKRARLVPPTDAARPRSSRVRFGSPWTWLAVVVVVLAVWGVAAAVSLQGVRRDVSDARSVLEIAQRDLLDGQVESATTRFGEAEATLDSVPGRVSSPLVWPARLVPTYRRTLNAVGSLARAGQIAAGAAADVSAQIGRGDGGLGALTPRDGRIPLEQIAALTPVLRRAAGDLDDAVAIARDTSVFAVEEPVAEGREELLALLQPAAEQLHLGASVTQVLPSLFGADGPRRYLVVASNPAEARGSGGFFGAFTVLEAADGEMTFGPVLETQDLPIPPDESVAWPDPSLAERWDAYGGATRVRSINLTPDFPSAAQTLENYWTTVYDEELDGVIAVDPFAFEALLSISGPVDVPGFGEVASEDVVEFVTYEAYAFEEVSAARKGLIGTVATSALQGFLQGPGDVSPGAVLRALAGMAERNSLLIHSVRPEEQALLVELGLAGELTTADRDLLAVVTNSGSGSKVDYFLDRSVRYDVTFEPDGSVTGVVSAGFVNTAPTSGELTYMIGPPNPDVPFEAGDNVLHVSVYCAPGCTVFEVPDAGYEDLPTERGVELGFPVASTWTLIPSMRSRELIYSMTVPGVWHEDGDDLVYGLHYRHQTAVRPTSVEVRVDIPEDHTPSAVPDGAVVEDGAVVVSLEATADVDLDFRFTRG